MAKTTRRGASRKPVRQAKQPVAWKNIMRQAMLLSMVVMLIAAVFYLRQSDTLPILHVTVEGEFSHVDKAVLVKAVGPYTRGGFLSVDVAKIRQAGEALPWVRSIQVRRIWPDSLHLIVEEQVAVARWNNKALVNQQGERFSSSKAGLPKGLALLQGPEVTNKLMTQRYIAMGSELQKHQLKISKLVMDERRAWSLMLSNGVRVVLGRANSEQRFKRFIRIYQNGLQQYQSQIAEMDMRYPNGLSVIWKPGQKPDFNGTV